MTKVLIKVLKITVVLAMILIATATLITEYEKIKNPPIGRLVDVDGESMHVYMEGSGKRTIVLLGGLGTTSPAIDFMPLIRRLRDRFKVVVVEGFGYGWSDLTKRERSVERIVDEIHGALSAADIDGPIILMPHSVSGVYALYYADMYPKDVEAIIGIDATLPRMLEYFDGEPPKANKALGAISPLGISRVALLLSGSSFLPKAEPGEYAPNEIDLIKMITAWKAYNYTVINEINRTGENMHAANALEFPSELPVLLFFKEANTKFARGDGKTRESFYKQYLENVENGELVRLKGHHYLHWTLSNDMAREVERFIEAIDDMKS